MFVNNGAIGTGNIGGGAGGGFSAFPDIIGAGDHDIRTKYPSMTGLDGGAIGEPGGSDPYVIYGTGVSPAGSFAAISAQWGLRRGGDAGEIVDAGATSIQIVTGGDGFFKGTATDIQLS